MRPNSGDNQAKGLTLRNLVYKIANLILPVERQDIVGDVLEISWPQRAYEFARSSLSIRKTEIRRGLIPPLKIRCNLPDRPEKHRRMNQVFDILQRAMWWFALTRLAYISLNAMLLPDDNVLQFTFIVGSTIPLIFLVRLHREGVGTRFCTRTPPSVTGAMEIEELKRKRDLLSGGHFNPSGFALVSVLEATVFMLQFFGPAYATIRWFQGEPLPIYTDWTNMACRFVVGIILLFLWVCIRKSNMLAAAIFDEEIHALQSDRYEQVSA